MDVKDLRGSWKTYGNEGRRYEEGGGKYGI